MATAGKPKRDWVPIIIQTISILMVIIGFSLANEHRLTVVEVTEANTIRKLEDVGEIVSMLQQNQVVIQQNQARVLAIIERIENGGHR